MANFTNGLNGTEKHSLSKHSTAAASGFTIIEVLIVLAIAGLIMLIVFLAVPALQRNQRNTGRRNDAGRISGSVNNFVANNNGSLPGTVSVANDCNTVLTDTGTLNQYTGMTCNAATAGFPAAFTSNNVYIVTNPGTVATIPSATSNTVIIVEHVLCNGSQGTTTITTNQAAIFYTLETGGGNQWICLNVK